MKLTKAQQEVINLMGQAWELGTSSGITSRCWLQKNGLGRGGDTKTISYVTKNKLESMGLIVGTYKFPITKYELTELGKQHVKETYE